MFEVEKTVRVAYHDWSLITAAYLGTEKKIELKTISYTLFIMIISFN